MSRLDDLERELFQAASSEEPSPALRQRIHQQLNEFAGKPTPKRPNFLSRNASVLVAGFWGAAALAAMALLMLKRPGDEEGVTTVEAERLPPPATAPAKPPLEEPPVVEPRVVASVERVQPQQRPVRAPRSLAEQLEVLGQARAALRAGNGGRALTLLDEYAQRKNSVDMNAEAMLLRIEALQAVGQRDQANRLAQQLIKRYPDNPLADRARALVRTSGNENGNGNGTGENRNDHPSNPNNDHGE